MTVSSPHNISQIFIKWPTPPTLEECKQRVYLDWKKDKKLSREEAPEMPKVFLENFWKDVPIAFEKFEIGRSAKKPIIINGVPLKMILIPNKRADNLDMEKFEDERYPGLIKYAFSAQFNLHSDPSPDSKADELGFFSSFIQMFTFKSEAMTTRGFGMLKVDVNYQGKGIAPTFLDALHDVLKSYNIPITFLLGHVLN